MAWGTLTILLATVALALCDPLGQGVLHVRHRRLAVEDRPNCKPGATPPPTVVDTTARLAEIRRLFGEVPGGAVHAYIVPNEDAHQSEYPSNFDQRRGYISGFTGSAGTAVVLANDAAVWTDGRYHDEAEDALDCNWILMKQGVEGVPSISGWLVDQLKNIPGARVGASPFLMNARTWTSYSTIFAKAGISMVEVNDDLIDQIWTSDRPPQPSTTINALSIEYAGKTWEEKISDVRDKFASNGAGAYIVTSLDETAWLFNARASDITYNPFFISYAIVETSRVRLYLLDHITKLTTNPTDINSTAKLHEHLKTSTNGSCSSPVSSCVEVLAYNAAAVSEDIKAIANNNVSIWVSLYCNQAIYSTIPEAQRIHDKSAIALMKSQKNAVERAGMQASHIRDAVALIKFMEKLEREVKAGQYWSEVTADADLKKYRLEQNLNRGLSFGSIAGSGSNGAIIHYSPTNATDKQITTSDMFLLDSGGQYLDGTTDVTRTFHFGVPSDYQKECYTRVLMGHIDLALLKWPKGLYGREIDAITRAPLWEAGLIYLHGTGHGIGAYLSVHEGPGRISLSHDLNPSDEVLDEYMFFSDEPGYYEKDQFGIRLETIVMVEKVNVTYPFPDTVYLGFRPITLVPYEPNLIKKEMLSAKQIKWLNDYHKRVEQEVGPKLSGAALQWVKARTTPISTQTVSSAQPHAPALLLTVLSAVLWWSCLH
ncbi:xaa-Pro aminopeptidase ApepP-like [Haliotis rufescens]|uniref:xaa-Pro aminopeptidase ApepP-like n=1 Tax=Haliotis rufescens TaxID=6454 RepID=UPI00201EC132|nr:xaa-Pro aminopeptidase ApepP-like [Haliotis rufescens]